MSETIRFGILGFGNHASRVMAKAFQEAHSASVGAIATRSRERAEEVQKAFPQATIYTDFNELLADRNLDAIYIALPNHLHFEWVIAALKCRKHVLCEKPLATHFEQAVVMKEAVEESGCKLAEGFMYRFHPQHAEVKRLLSRQMIGELRLLEVHLHYTLENRTDIRAMAQGGGGLLDVGCYGIDCAHFLFEDSPVQASGSWTIDRELGIDECAVFQLLFPGGRVAHITCGCRLPRENRYSLYGSLGSLTLPSAFLIPRNKSATILLSTTEENGLPIAIPPANQFVLEIDHFVRLVRGEPIPEGLFSDWFANARVLEMVRSALLTGGE